MSTSLAGLGETEDALLHAGGVGRSTAPQGRHSMAGDWRADACVVTLWTRGRTSTQSHVHGMIMRYQVAHGHFAARMIQCSRSRQIMWRIFFFTSKFPITRWLPTLASRGSTLGPLAHYDLCHWLGRRLPATASPRLDEPPRATSWHVRCLDSHAYPTRCDLRTT